MLGKAEGAKVTKEAVVGGEEERVAKLMTVLGRQPKLHVLYQTSWGRSVNSSTAGNLPVSQ